MAEGVLTNTGEDRVLQWLRAPTTSGIAPVLPYKVRLLTALGSDTAAGTQATGPSYAAQTFAPGVPFADTDGDFVMQNPAIMRYEQLDASTIVGAEIWDSAATAIRWAHGALEASVSVAQGGPFEFAVGKCRWKMR
ncbi:hypothetical protein BH24ACT15_BH24ACT15_37900 [soil metagenome]|jgi:hypothetical protein